MKKITFESIRLLNFCGIRDARFDFGGQSVILSASNGRGKSTVAKAITYCLFGTDLRGNQFDIKTYDTAHRIIPEIEHSVELIMHVDGDPITLKRTLTDSWKGESVKNTYKYFIDGNATTASDFKQKVDSICAEITFRLASSPTYFLSKTWQEQRKFLECLVPPITADAITGGDTKYDIVTEALRKQDLDHYINSQKYRRGEVQKQLDEIPTKLATLNKTLPDKQDWEALKDEKARLQEEYNTLQQEVVKAKAGAANTVLQEGLQAKINLAEKRKREMERSARVMAGDAEVKHSSDLINARTTHQKAQSTVTELQSKMDGFTDTEVHIKQQMDEAKKNVKALNDKQHEIYSRHWEWNDKDSFCPHCGQALPLEDVARIKQESEERFNAQKVADLKAVRKTFSRISDEYTEAKNLLAQLEEDRKLTTNQLVEAQKALKEAEKHLADVKAITPKDEDTILTENPIYAQVVKELLDLNRQLDTPQATDEQTQELIASLEAQLTEKQTLIRQLWDKIKMEDTYLKVSGYIKEAQADKKKYQEQIDDLSSRIDIATEYQEKFCALLEEEVNKHFSYVKWSMFKPNLDGEKKPYCECYHNGVPYSSDNYSSQINAGIDIANTIARYYDVSVPIILDNCESNLHPLYSLGQQIRFTVTHDEEIKVEQIVQVSPDAD